MKDSWMKSSSPVCKRTMPTSCWATSKTTQVLLYIPWNVSATMTSLFFKKKKKIMFPETSVSQLFRGLNIFFSFSFCGLILSGFGVRRPLSIRDDPFLLHWKGTESWSGEGNLKSSIKFGMACIKEIISALSLWEASLYTASLCSRGPIQRYLWPL